MSGAGLKDRSYMRFKIEAMASPEKFVSIRLAVEDPSCHTDYGFSESRVQGLPPLGCDGQWRRRSSTPKLG